MGLKVSKKGKPSVHIPREVSAEGGKAIDAYVEDAWGKEEKKTGKKEEPADEE